MYTYSTTADRGYFLSRTFAAAAATLLTAVWLAAAQPAHAGEPTVATARVSYADLNLQSEAGVRALYRRLERAAERVCDGADRRSIGWRECYETALAGAVKNIGAPQLTALHRAHGAGAARSG